MSFPWLTALGVVPLIGAILVMAVPEARSKVAKQIALAVSLIPVVLIVIMATMFDTDQAGTRQFTESYTWIDPMGVKFALGANGLSFLLIAMAVILVPVVIAAGWYDADRKRDAEDSGPIGSVRGFFALILVLETFMIWIFAASDLFLFYILFEGMLIPVYFLIGRYGGPRRAYAAMKFLLYSLLGGLLMLASMIVIYVLSVQQFGKGTFDIDTLATLSYGEWQGRWLFLGFFIAFAIKAPMVPVHTWLPDTVAESTPGTSTLLVGVLDKVGTFGMLALCLPLFPEASGYFTPAIVTLAVISVIYGAILAIGQTDFYRFIGYTSVSHFGFIVLGIFVLTPQGISGAGLYMINHGFTTAGLFLIAGFLVQRRGTQRMGAYSGVTQRAPILAGTFLLVGLSALALPGLSSFVSEFLVFVGAFPGFRVAAVISVLGIILSSVYILLTVQRTMHGELAPGLEDTKDLNGRERWALVPVIAIIVALGFFPQPLLNVLNPVADQAITQVDAATSAEGVES